MNAFTFTFDAYLVTHTNDGDKHGWGRVTVPTRSITSIDSVVRGSATIPITKSKWGRSEDFPLPDALSRVHITRIDAGELTYISCESPDALVERWEVALRNSMNAPFDGREAT